jgi:hypothetical protein
MSNFLNYLNGIDMPNYGMHVDKYHFFEIISLENNLICKLFSKNNLSENFLMIRWLSNARFCRFARHRSAIRGKHLLLMDNHIFQIALLEMRRVILEYQQLPLLPKLLSYDL